MAVQFKEMACMVTGSDKDYIINMNQSPIPFTFTRQHTLEFVGIRTVYICKSTDDTKWATLALTIMVLGKILTPVLEFKGKPDGHFAI